MFCFCFFEILCNFTIICNIGHYTFQLLKATDFFGKPVVVFWIGPVTRRRCVLWRLPTAICCSKLCFSDFDVWELCRYWTVYVCKWIVLSQIPPMEQIGLYTTNKNDISKLFVLNDAPMTTEATLNSLLRRKLKCQSFQLPGREDSKPRSPGECVCYVLILFFFEILCNFTIICNIDHYTFQLLKAADFFWKPVVVFWIGPVTRRRCVLWRLRTAICCSKLCFSDFDV